MELLFVKYLSVFFIFVLPSNSKDFNNLRIGGPSENMYNPTATACYNKFVGSKGTIQSPVLHRAYQYPVDCLWDIDVTDSYTIEFEFEIFSLPKSDDHKCGSYIEFSYVLKNQDGTTKRLFCPSDLVDKVYIDSSTAHIRFHSDKYIEEYGNDSYGFKINFSAISEDKPSTNPAPTIVLVCFATLFIITVCVICIRSHRTSQRIGPIPNHVIVPAAPNAPTRADLQSAFDIHLSELTQAPQNGSRYMSRTCPNLSDFTDGKIVSIPHQNKEDRRVADTFIVTTPRSVFPAARPGLTADSARRIADLRTRLVARFSSVSNDSSDRSVFLSASSSMNYSQLAPEEEEEEEDRVLEEGRPQQEERRRTASSIGRKNIPSIVIEFFK